MSGSKYLQGKSVSHHVKYLPSQSQRPAQHASAVPADEDVRLSLVKPSPRHSNGRKAPALGRNGAFLTWTFSCGRVSHSRRAKSHARLLVRASHTTPPAAGVRWR